jgi:1,4-dihydroxy-2-naphthoate polyprenyltransferase
MGAGASAARPGGVKVWLLAARPATLPAAVTPVIVGSAVAAAAGQFRLLPFLAAFVCALLIQIGTNLANDYFDYQKGADTAERLGPPRVTQSGLLPPTAVRNATILTFGLAALVGLYCVMMGGWVILAIGLACIAAGVLYTGGPWPYGYHALGDLLCFVFFGFVAVAGTTYLQALAFTREALVASIPVGCMVTAILVVNNLRDIDTDRATNKRTLAVYLGRTGTRWEYVVLLVVAYVTPLVWRLAGGTSSMWFWLPWLSLPLAVSLVRLIWREQGRPLNAALKGTARLHLVFGMLLALSVLV